MYGIPGFLHLANLAELYSAVTGIETTSQELKKAGARAFNLLKVLNVRAGFSRVDDAFPKVWLQAKNTPEGTEFLEDYYRHKRLNETDLAQVLIDYYLERGWDPKTGVPNQETLVNLGLIFI